MREVEGSISKPRIFDWNESTFVMKDQSSQTISIRDDLRSVVELQKL